MCPVSIPGALDSIVVQSPEFLSGGLLRFTPACKTFNADVASLWRFARRSACRHCANFGRELLPPLPPRVLSIFQGRVQEAQPDIAPASDCHPERSPLKATGCLFARRIRSCPKSLAPFLAPYWEARCCNVVSSLSVRWSTKRVDSTTRTWVTPDASPNWRLSHCPHAVELRPPWVAARPVKPIEWLHEKRDASHSVSWPYISNVLGRA